MYGLRMSLFLGQFLQCEEFKSNFFVVLFVSFNFFPLIPFNISYFNSKERNIIGKINENIKNIKMQERKHL